MTFKTIEIELLTILDIKRRQETIRREILFLATFQCDKNNNKVSSYLIRRCATIPQTLRRNSIACKEIFQGCEIDKVLALLLNISLLNFSSFGSILSHLVICHRLEMIEVQKNRDF
jgi:hypothetical protein